ncbi:MAG: DUF2752 domain-containing protein [Ignavibacteria bacterium]|nr:DUF2752 domain-containing protein [Ignavibacteria bacterium]
MTSFSLQKITSKESWKIRGIIFGIVAMGLVTVYVSPYQLFFYFLDSDFAKSNQSYCLFINITGLPCPFCGLSRSFRGLVNLNFEDCLYYNPSSIFLFLFGGLVIISVFILSLFNYKISVSKVNKLWFVLLMFLIVEWIINIIFGHH